jgi:8-amino-7-oxononanoate synthase
LVGALGKAVGTHGGFVAGSRLLRRYLWNRARSFVFSTAPSPAHAALTLDRVRTAQAAEGARIRLEVNAKTLRAGLSEAGFSLVPGSFGPIVSVILGENRRATEAAARLGNGGILAHAVRPPTVPAGSARLRLTVNAMMGDADIARLNRAVQDACRAS